ncbi:DUF1109 domain-containing protein [Sphingomonas oligophenolica]|uniref:DUF1109 domain-containing protein n=1 Tax=Sphingomonas oligophenolica TaxID=301154 RepID=A0A502CAQ9_9SPHN|nr:DUF1109 domain-containing protein [Sphingomonas oligophenolica]TPG09933.1 DUF1109 domain-containing protein [Sphingomonas oligophenolica]
MTGSTDLLIASLSANPARVGRRDVPRRLAITVAVAGVVTFAIIVAWLGFRPDLAGAIHRPTIWMKWAYTGSIAAVALIVLRQLARPEAARARGIRLAAVPLALLAAVALIQLALTPPGEMMPTWLGHSWRDCGMRIVALSLPIFAGLMIAFRRFAPTRPRLTGAVAGLAAGGVGATLYGFACPETSAMFVVTFYTLGLAMATLVGLIVGPRFLRW